MKQQLKQLLDSFSYRKAEDERYYTPRESFEEQYADLIKEDGVKKHSALSKVQQTAWETIVQNFNDCTSEVQPCTFSIGTLTQIIKLKPFQQLELVTDLAGETINKQRK